MPWSVKENVGSCKGYGVVDKDGKLVSCHGADKAAADKHVKALYANEKMEQSQDRILLERVGPALVAVAVTAKPHLRQRGKEIRMVEIDGKRLVEVPLYKKGIYRPKGDSGPIVFNDLFVKRMVDNHQKKVTDYNVHLDFRHDEKIGALAFLDPDDGGWLETKDDGWLYAYGPPTDDTAVDIINSRKWRYASPEFAPNYESNFVQKLSSDDLTEISIENLVETEEVMPKVLTLGPKAITLEGEVQDGQVSEIEAAYKEVADKVTALEAEVKKLTPDPEPQLPEPYRLRLEALEAENRQLERERRDEKVNLVLEKARNHRDGRGYGHDKVFLDLVETALRLKDYEQDGLTIKLEDGGKIESLVKFYNNVFTTLLEKCPGTVPLKGQTQGSEVRLESGNGHYTPEELEKAQSDFWN